MTGSGAPGGLPPDTVEIADPSGSTRIWVSAVGRPLRVQLSPALLARGADAVAQTVVELCRQARR